jgi:excisionase family DNA binding protein
VEAGAFLGLTRQAVSKLIAEGQIPFRRFGRRALRVPWDWLHEQMGLAREEQQATIQKKSEAVEEGGEPRRKTGGPRRGGVR